MSSFEEFGFSNRNEVLENIATLQGKDPASLLNPLNAEKWFTDYIREQKLEGNGPVAMTNVLLLKQIHSLDENVASDYCAKVMHSEVARKDLKQVLESIKKSQGVPGAIGHERWRRSHNFSTLAENYIDENLARFTNRPNPVLKQRNKSASLPCDLEIWSEGHPAAAIEIKVTRQKSTRSFRAEILGLASLLCKEFLEVIIIFSRGAKKPLEEIVMLRNELRLKEVRIATLDEELCQIERQEALRFW